MNMDFKSAKELLDLCEENQLPISEVMRQRECLLGETPRDAVDHRMAKAWEIMRASATQPLKKPIKSMGGLIGGEAKKLETHYNKKKNICGDVLQKAMTYAMAVLEVNASMGLIVAAPTAGSAGGAGHDAGPAGVLPHLRPAHRGCPVQRRCRGLSCHA